METLVTLDIDRQIQQYPAMIMEALDALKRKQVIDIQIHGVQVRRNASRACRFAFTSLEQNERQWGTSVHQEQLPEARPDAPRAWRGRPPKPKESLPPGAIPAPAKPRGRPRKDPNAPPAPKKPKPSSGPPSISKTGRPRGRPRKVNPQPLMNGTEV
ncbi:hypothetical protein DH2020_040381 [Rehmannia glutinosa]|uniref:Uncharacterized protein n=1 Tax=Rehmannia glutinosa TaxID=99300 RepID=A0ABR0UUD3_REHGL